MHPTDDGLDVLQDTIAVPEHPDAAQDRVFADRPLLETYRKAGESAAADIIRKRAIAEDLTIARAQDRARGEETHEQAQRSRSRSRESINTIAKACVELGELLD